MRPVLIKHCYECHSRETGKSKGGLFLDSQQGWQTGGDSGPAIVPHKPEGSTTTTRLLLLPVLRQRITVMASVLMKLPRGMQRREL
ncbi:MAG: c-type cytochrome domain-containing protein [Pirellulales bacterium]